MNKAVRNLAINCAALLGAVLIAFTVACGSSGYTDDKGTNNHNTALDDITVTKCSADDTQFFHAGVTVHNSSKDPSTYSINLEAVDASGKRLGTAVVFINDLRPGQTTDEEGIGSITEGATIKQCKIVSASKY